MKNLYLALLVLISLSVQAQMPKWILGSSQYNDNGGFHSLATNQLSFFEIDFTGEISASERTVGQSIQEIMSVGTQDVITTAVDETGEVLFYAFAAATVPFQSGGPSTADKIYFAAYDENTGADEVFGQITTEGWACSVIESELVRVPGSEDSFYFIYKTKATSVANDDVRYVRIHAMDHTVSSSEVLSDNLKNGEGMAVSQIICPQVREDGPFRWLFTSHLDNEENIVIDKFQVTSTEIIYDSQHVINISGNVTGVIGAIEISTDNNMIAIANYNTAGVDQDVILFDLNPLTGEFNNERHYMNYQEYPFVTMEFSPDGSRIFLLQAGSINYPHTVYSCPVVNSNYLVTAGDALTGMVLTNTLTMEMAFDGKLYISPNPNANFLYTVENPNDEAPTVVSTITDLFGPGNRIGAGFPDQVDGENPLIQSCDLVDVIDNIRPILEQIHIYPNPTKNVLFINLTSLDHQYPAVDINLIGSTGQIIKKLTRMNCSTVVELTVEDLAAGVYHLQVLHDRQIVAAGQFIRE